MEWYRTKCGKYKIESMTAATLPKALEVMRKSFIQEEACSVGSEVNKNPIAAEESLDLCVEAALDGVSLVAIETATGEVAAVLFNKFAVPSLPTDKPYIETLAEHWTQPESREIVEFMRYVDKKCNLWDLYKVECMFEVGYLATLPEHRHQKLGLHLCRVAVDLAKQLKNNQPVSKITKQDLGPKYSHLKVRPLPNTYPKVCSVLWTAFGSQKIGQRLNFKVHEKVYFSELMFKGKTYAARLGDDSPKFFEIAALPLY